MTLSLIYSKIFYILKIQFLNLGQHGQQKNKIASAKLTRLFENHLIEKKGDKVETGIFDETIKLDSR